MSREQRLGELLKKEIASIIQLKVRDDRIGFVSVTGVEVSGDLSYAKVYISTFGSDRDRQNSIKGLQHATGFIKKELGRTIKLRQMPKITFIDDKSIERGDRILQKLKELEQERSESPSDE